MKSIVFTIIILSSFCFSQDELSLPDNSSQLIIMITDTINSIKGSVFYFEKNDEWQKIDGPMPAALGKSGLGWGRGIHDFVPGEFPVKKEGDGRTPAGMFKLGPAFGFADPGVMKDLKIPYLQITDMLECVDDVRSEYYNQLVNRDSVDKVDWNSSEEMSRYGKWYEQGIFIQQNDDPEVTGAGSCIFIHNWVDPDETSMGCTEMEPGKLKRLIYWLDADKNPVLIQLPAYLYKIYNKKWRLPE